MLSLLQKLMINISKIFKSDEKQPHFLQLHINLMGLDILKVVEELLELLDFFFLEIKQTCLILVL